MWSQYADNHRGIIIEFDTQHKFFNQTINTTKEYTLKNQLLGRLFRVKYDKTRLSIYESLTNLPDSLNILNKSDDWMHEKEYRMFLPRDLRDSYGLSSDGKIDKKIDLFRIPGDAISKVILGLRCNKETIISEINHTKTENSKLNKIIIEESISHPKFYHIIHKNIAEN